MIVGLRALRLKDEPLDVDAHFTEAQLRLTGPLLRLGEPVKARLLVRASGDRAQVRGSLRGAISVTCCRCAKPFPQTVDKEFSVDYWPDPEVEENEELELAYEDLDVGFYRNDELDLSAVVSEQIVLDVPMKPVCRDDCRGLCDRCGADLNEGDCGCDRTQVDARLAALAEWKLKRGK
jgi:uncharacterized protein